MSARATGLAVLVWVVGTACALGQDEAGTPPSPQDPLRAVRAEIHVKSLYSPSQPIPVGFMLFNSSSETLEVPLESAADPAGIALPLQLVLGTADKPRLFLTYEDEKPVAMRSSLRAGPGSSGHVLRLAPHGAVGTELDLRDLHRQLRYAGAYRLEWRPLSGHIAAALAGFRVEPRKDAIIVTDYGKMIFSLMYERAPKNVENFLELARGKFYDGKTFHRIVPGFLLQGGCPLGNGKGMRPDGKTVPAEFHDAPIELGTLVMARRPDDPNSASCQFFIALARLEDLDEKYTVIGQARDEESLRTLRQLADARTDRQDRPLRPMTIRFVTLVDAEAGAPRRFDSGRP